MGINIYQILRWQPGGPGGQNTYTAWPALQAAILATPGFKRIVCDDTLGALVIPTGAQNINGCQFDSAPNFNNANGGAIITVADGATFVPDASGNYSFTLGRWTAMYSASATTAPITAATGELNISLEPFSVLNATGSHGFFHVTSGLAYLWLHMTNASIGDSSNPTIVFEVGAGGQINMDSSEIHTLACQGAGIAGLGVFYDSASGIEKPNPVTLNPEDFNHGTFHPAGPIGAAAPVVFDSPNYATDTGIVRVTGMITAAGGTTVAGETLQAQLRVDGGLIATSPLATADAGATLKGASFTLMWEVSGLALGNHTFGIQVSNVTNAGHTLAVSAVSLASIVVHDIGNHAI